MKLSLLCSLCIVCFLFVSNSGKAQPVITEYFSMQKLIKIDLSDKKVQKAVYTKGVLDIAFNPNNLLLAITYDPKIADNKDIWKSLQEIIDLNSANTAIPKPQTK